MTTSIKEETNSTSCNLIEVGDRVRTCYGRKTGVVRELIPREVDKGASCHLLIETDAGDQYVVHEYCVRNAD